MQYTEFYYLRKNPFGETPNTEFYYPSASHEYALSTVYQAILDNHGFSVLTGEVGTGKTLLTRILIHRLKGHAQTALILNPVLNECELMRAICQEFGLAKDTSSTLSDYAEQLNAFLISNALQGKRAVLIIDEAQKLPVATLEMVRLLTNLESESQKLLQIVLVAQPELEGIVSQHELRQLAQRISVYAYLQALTEEDSAAYINHRIRCAGGENFLRFDKKASKLVHEYCCGLPRLLNKCCELILLHGQIHSRRLIDYEFVKEVLGVGILKLRFRRLIGKSGSNG